MLYIISKETFGDYSVHDIQSNSCWCECVLDGYVSIPDELVEGILATQGYCNLVLNEDQTAVVSFTAREIPDIPDEPSGPVNSGLLEVVVDKVEETASHSSTEILSHLERGGTAVMVYESGSFKAYVPLYMVMGPLVVFRENHPDGEVATYIDYIIREDGSVSTYEGYAESNGVKNYSVVRDGQTITMTLTRDNNDTETHVITLDENDYPTSISVNGKTITGEWSGF